MKTLDAKLAAIHADPAGAPDFILADAKDADMAFGLAATGIDPATGRPRSLAAFRDQMREVVRQGLVDIMLMSASTNDVLAAEGVFAGSAVTPAVRANDSTDIHVLAGSPYPTQPSRPLRTPRIDEIMRGGTDLALYSLTPAGDAERDATALEAYRDFRAEAERAGLRHFLEVFAPNVAPPMPDVSRFLNDFVARTLAGVPASGRPVFLKMPYGGPRAMEALVSYDPHLVVGVLGGSAGTTHDAFRLIEEARRHGARAALFGRKINRSEHQLTFVRWLRAIADGRIEAADACRSYHADLERIGVRPFRPLAEDLQLTDPALVQASGREAG
ncbi:MAG: hypothetical protein H6Q10_3141 [Acidobacteria bacterium]|jgi:hypothetical protein|nr:hypothetical protein [Acidobacteriota bacterium]